jgi:hypothetical protein
MRQRLIVVDDFYADPRAVRDYAIHGRWYYPYQRNEAVRAGRVVPQWMASRFREALDCPFKSSRALIECLEGITGARIDLDHWRLSFPTDDEGKATRDCTEVERSCFWNCSFHVKPATSQTLGEGVHNHVTDIWNSVGEDGWAGLIYLTPDAPLDGGLKLWTNVDPAHNYDWMTPPENWRLVDDIGNVFNRLILARGDVPHSGAAGWGSGPADGRLYQTFFFRVLPGRPRPVVADAESVVIELPTPPAKGRGRDSALAPHDAAVAAPPDQGQRHSHVG